MVFGHLKHRAKGWNEKQGWQTALTKMNLEPLTTIGEVAIAIAGFAGIVIVFGDRGRRGVPLVLRISTRGMLLCSLAVVFAAFIPFVFANLKLSETSVWFWSCGVLATFLLVLISAAARDGARVKEAVRLLYRVIGAIPLFLALIFALAGLLPTFSWAAGSLYVLARKSTTWRVER